MRPILLCILLLAAACTYSTNREWFPSSQYVTDPTAVREPFRSALRACVAQNDPEHLADFDQTGTYKLSGLTVSTDRTDRVEQCMRPKGWITMPTAMPAVY